MEKNCVCREFNCAKLTIKFFFSFLQKLYVNQQLKQNQYAVPWRQLYSSKSQSYSDKKNLLVLPSDYRVSRVTDIPRNRAIMERYKTLVTIHYKEPGQDGQFDDCTKNVLEELCEDDYSDAEEELKAKSRKSRI